MSAEATMLADLSMPTREVVETELLRALIRHGGAIEEFSSAHDLVRELADEFGLTEPQRTAFLTTTYRKENRLKRSILWHRLLFRAADALAKARLVTRPAQTRKESGRSEWMLTEKGLDAALSLYKIPVALKSSIMTKSFEVQQVANALQKAERPEHYDPFNSQKTVKVTKCESVVRDRGFRLAVTEAYNFKCAACGLKICAPHSLTWEVQAAHIAPNYLRGKDDIWNGIALCRLHHWAFDVGWFAVLDDYRIQFSDKLSQLPEDFGRIAEKDVIRQHLGKPTQLFLPENVHLYPHLDALRWHRKHVFSCRRNIGGRI